MSIHKMPSELSRETAAATRPADANPSADAVGYAAAMVLGPAALGCAAGVLLSEDMERGARRATALVLFAIGVAAVAPFVADYLSRQVNGPATARGQQRTRQIIRDGSLPVGADFLDDGFPEAPDVFELRSAG